MIKPMTKKKEFSMGSHLPVLGAILEVFKPEGIMELGAGIKSTPLLYNYGKKLVSIESDKEWVDVVRAKTGSRENFKLVHHEIGHDMHRKAKYPSFTKEITKECVAFYNKFLDDDLDFLFVDHVSGLRPIALMYLYKHFKIVAFHDVQDWAYRYDVFYSKEGLVPKNYLHLNFESFVSHTGILIHHDHRHLVEEFDKALRKYSEKYCEEFGRTYKKHTLRRY